MSEPRPSSDRPEMDGTAARDFELLAAEILPALIARLRASGLAELEVRRDGWRVRLRRDLRTPRRSRSAAGDASPAETADDAVPGMARSPAVGYFSPVPTLRVGLSVQAGDPLGGIDVLGIAVEVVAPSGGLISAVLVEAGQAVEYGQVLAEIEALAEPSGEAGPSPASDGADVVPGSPLAEVEVPPGATSSAAGP